MKSRFFTVMLLLIFLVSLTGNAGATSSTSPDSTALIYVNIGSPNDISRFASTELPMFALLNEGLLTGTDRTGQRALVKAGLSFQVVDTELRSGSYYIAETRSNREIPDFALYGRDLLDISNGVLLQMNPLQVDALTQIGIELRAITLTPKPLPAALKNEIFADVVNPDPIIQGMMDQVSTDQIYQYDQGLAGEIPVWVDGASYTIQSRNTNSGIPIQKTTHYVGQHMADLGLNVEYQVWDDSTNPNVIGEISGEVNPDEIYIIGGHIDDVNGTPGADDNASGSVATLIAADILSQYQWGCTLRFAFWTGEEQGLLGSRYYAQRAYQQGENIMGYLNLDMIAWNTINSQPTIFLGYRSSVPSSHDLANMFADVVDVYNIDLLSVMGTDYYGSSDHTSFLEYGYPAILGIEGDDDFNPYYHGTGDTTAHTNPVYFTNYVKASVGTLAHMSNCLIPNGIGNLDGHVTAAFGGVPIEGAKVIAERDQGSSISFYTDVTGYYNHPLLPDTYTVTASSYGYLPFSVNHVTITSDTITTQDFALVTAPTSIVSGTVTESGSGLPLLAEINFVGTPITVWSDPSTGFYQAELPEDSYTMKVRSALHLSQEREITLDHNQTQNFVLDPLPCILLVDDDQNNPDVRSYFTSALNDLAYAYNVWDISTLGDPGEADLSGYKHVLWTTGRPSSNTFTGSNEAAVGAYLDEGGNFFLSSHEYLYDFGLTPFGTNYLGISNYTNDVQRSDVTGNAGNPIGAGLGPYSLVMPPGWTTNWSDNVTGTNAPFRWAGTGQNNSVNKDGATYRTAFFAWPFEGLSNLSARSNVLGSVVEWFGGCGPTNGLLEGHVTDAGTGAPLEGVLVTTTPGVAAVQGITDPTGYYSMTLPAGTYTVTASLDGYTTQSTSATIVAEQVTTLNFALQSTCEPVTGLNFTWLPAEPFTGDLVTFTATASGTEPIDFQWEFGDTYTGTGTTVTHSYAEAITYTVSLSATNACGTDQASKEITIWQQIWEFFLPMVENN